MAEKEERPILQPGAAIGIPALLGSKGTKAALVSLGEAALRLVALCTIMVLLLCGIAQAATWTHEIEKRTGELITITWDYDTAVAEQLTGWALYRQTGVSSSELKIATCAPHLREMQWIMPGGTTKQYRLILRPVRGTSIGPAGEEWIITRIK